MIKFCNLISCGSKDIYLKILFVSCTDTHYAVTDLANHEMAKADKLEYLKNRT